MYDFVLESSIQRNRTTKLPFLLFADCVLVRFMDRAGSCVVSKGELFSSQYTLHTFSACAAQAIVSANRFVITPLLSPGIRGEGKCGGDTICT